jgi:hypothetical protein
MHNGAYMVHDPYTPTVFLLQLLNQFEAASYLLRQAEKDVVTKDLPGTKEKEATEDGNA